MSLVTEEIKAKANIFHGEELCREKTKELFMAVGLPLGIIPLDEIEECGHVPENNFIWFRRKKLKRYKFERLGKWVSYAAEVTGYAEEKKIKKLTGIKSKEIAVWITVSEVSVNDPAQKVTFTTPAGLFRSYPISVFEGDQNFKEMK
ncbi:hypothetical protein GIB67_014583 [Kingdonia uniflora]|uniref:DUF538 domain-containing protein n=1 Tax=Kingdonia uniflora TaxID=39325 RepID=A0A7J7MP44_9MAGN|nr:hypothetical protein GIB67_014583 [Kingdonia uniflora]